MKHLSIHRARNLRDHGIFCDKPLTPSDVLLIGKGKKLIEHPDDTLLVVLSDGANAKISLMPDTDFPIVRAV